MSQVYKKALHSFFMKVHPDFFARSPQWQKTNEASIASLNELLSWAKDFKGGSNRPPPATSSDFTFYRRADEDAPSVEIRSQFNLPKGFVAGPTTVGVAERAVNKFLRDLLRRAGCLDEVTAGLSEGQDAEQTRQEQRRTSWPRMKARKVRTLLDEAVDSAAEVAMPYGAPSIDELVSGDQVVLSHDLSPQQTAVAIQTLTSGLPAMRYEAWCSMSLVLADRWGVESSDIRGSITVPWNFTVPQFQAFLREKQPQIARASQALEEFSERIEVLISDLCRELGIDDVLVSCSHAQAMPCLELLRDQVALLNLHGLRGISVEIGGHWGYRQNGVLMIAHDTTEESLRARLPRVMNLLPMLQKQYARAKAILESIEFHLREVVESLKPNHVDVFNADVTYDERLQFVQELFKVTPRLSQFDWGTITFVLTAGEEDVSVDWEGGIIRLPAHFDGDGLVRYVENIHSTAKEDERAEVRRVEDLRRLQDEKRSMAAHEDLANDAAPSKTSTLHHETNANEAYGVPTPSSMEGEEGDAAVTLGNGPRAPQPFQPPSSGLAANDAWKSEYLASSERPGEALSIERPLAHRVTFNSVEEAEDQMKWEKVDDPYARDVVRQSELQELSDVMLSARRSSRVEAIKRITEELQSKHYRSRRDGFKLGDVVGLTDANKRPEKLPIVARGTYQPPKGQY